MVFAAASLGFISGSCSIRIAKRLFRAPVRGKWWIWGALSAFLFAAADYGAILPAAALSWFLFFVLVLVAQMDLSYRMIKDVVVLPAVAAAGIIRFFVHPDPLWQYLAAGILAAGLFFFVSWLTLTFFRSEGFGGGDIKLMAFIGLFCGLKVVFLSLLLAFILGVMFSPIFRLFRMYQGHTYPFGVFAAMGTIVAYEWGNRLISIYAKLIISIFVH